MENLLHGIPCIIVRVDDILVGGKDDVDYLSNLHAVLTTLSTAGLRLKKSKCEFMVAQVTYCGYRISGSGVAPVKDKVEAIQKALEPQIVRAPSGILLTFSRAKFILLLNCPLDVQYNKSECWPA